MKPFGQGKTLGPGVLAHLMAYEWPGNVRELENVIERMVIISSGTVIGIDGLPVFNTLEKEEKDPVEYTTQNRERILFDLISIGLVVYVDYLSGDSIILLKMPLRGS